MGYDKGALALIDPIGLSKIADIRFKAHPEGFQIDETGTQAFVNVPNAAEIMVVDFAGAGGKSVPIRGVR